MSDITIYKVTGIRGYVGDMQHKLEYSADEEYYTVCYAGGRVIREGYISEYDFSGNEAEFEQWLDAVMDFINSHNREMSSRQITYEITGKRDNGTYSYIMKADGAEIERGVSGYRDIPAEYRKEWRNSVKKYLKNNNSETPVEKLKKDLSDIKKRVTLPDMEFGEKKSLELPGIAEAVASIKTEPCEFPDKLVTAIRKGPAGIKDMVSHNIAVVKHNLEIDLKMAANGFNILVGSAAAALIEKAESILDLIEEADAYQEEYRKKFATFIISVKELLSDEELPADYTMKTNDEKHRIPEKVAEAGAKQMKKMFNANRMPDAVRDRFTENFEKYFKQAFVASGVPPEMSLISVIESGVNNIANENSDTGKGIWMLTREDGAKYSLLRAELRGGVDPAKAKPKDLVITSPYDKRTDVQEASSAAAKLMADIRNEHPKIKSGGWLYVVAAYNYGAEKTEKAAAKAAQGDSTDGIWRLWPQLPKETQNYIAMLLALVRDMNWSTDALFE